MPTRHACLWERALPYLDTRSNDIHTLYSYRFARRLVVLHDAAEPEVVLPAVILHDVGWSTVPEARILESFGPNLRHPELRRQHEVEGARLAREILETCGHPAALTDRIVAIIDGHDTRTESRSIEDSLVRDADMLWRYTLFGLETTRAWFGNTEREQLDQLEAWIETRFHTEAGRHMAHGLMAALEVAADTEEA
jgi:HD superfamily phosphodiesterase